MKQPNRGKRQEFSQENSNPSQGQRRVNLPQEPPLESLGSLFSSEDNVSDSIFSPPNVESESSTEKKVAGSTLEPKPPYPKQPDKSRLKPSKLDVEQPNFGITSHYSKAIELELDINHISSIFPNPRPSFQKFLG